MKMEMIWMQFGEGQFDDTDVGCSSDRTYAGLVNFLPHRPKIMRISWLEGGENVIMKTIMVIRSRMITILTIILAAPGNSNALLPTG